jgi:hypothetical protein
MIRRRVRSWAREGGRWANDCSTGGGDSSVIGESRPGVTNVGGRQGRHPAPLATTEDRTLLSIFLLVGRGNLVMRSTSASTSSSLCTETGCVTLTTVQVPEYTCQEAEGAQTTQCQETNTKSGKMWTWRASTGRGLCSSGLCTR